MFIQTVGPVFCLRKRDLAWRKNPEEADVFEKSINHIRLIKQQVSTRMQVLIMNMDELKRLNWIAKVKTPSTLPRIVRPTSQSNSYYQPPRGNFGQKMLINKRF